MIRVASERHGHAHCPIEPAGQAVGETRGDLLHDEDRDRIVGRQLIEQAGQHLRATR